MSADADTNSATKNAVQKLLKDKFAQYRFERVDVRAGEDHTGDPALFIDAYYGLSDTPVDTRLILHTLTELRDVLLKMGEKRFPYVRHHFDEKQRVAKRK